jgi:hypothetical protein
MGRFIAAMSTSMPSGKVFASANSMMMIMIIAMIYVDDFAGNASRNCGKPTRAKFANERRVPRRLDAVDEARQKGACSIRRRNVPNSTSAADAVENWGMECSFS